MSGEVLYYRYGYLHALCNAHHPRELERALEKDHPQWAEQMQVLLIELAKTVEDTGRCLPPDEAKRWHRRYRYLLKKAEMECPSAW